MIPELRDHFEQERYNAALEFAAAAHGEQRRKYTNEPYYHHVINVAATVSRVPGRSIEMIEAALLHDVLEDTVVTEDTLRRVFSPLVAFYVLTLTDPPVAYGNRAERKAFVLEKMRLAAAEAKTIKVADLLDNTDSIVQHDPSFAKVYMREKADLLSVLEGADPELLDQAYRKLITYFVNERR